MCLMSVEQKLARRQRGLTYISAGPGKTWAEQTFPSLHQMMKDDPAGDGPDPWLGRLQMLVDHPCLHSTDESDSDDKQQKEWSHPRRRDRTPTFKAVITMLEEADKKNKRGHHSPRRSKEVESSPSLQSIESTIALLKRQPDLEWAVDVEKLEIMRQRAVTKAKDPPQCRPAGGAVPIEIDEVREASADLELACACTLNAALTQSLTPCVAVRLVCVGDPSG